MPLLNVRSGGRSLFRAVGVPPPSAQKPCSIVRTIVPFSGTNLNQKARLSEPSSLQNQQNASIFDALFQALNPVLPTLPDTGDPDRQCRTMLSAELGPRKGGPVSQTGPIEPGKTLYVHYPKPAHLDSRPGFAALTADNGATGRISRKNLTNCGPLTTSLVKGVYSIIIYNTVRERLRIPAMWNSSNSRRIERPRDETNSMADSAPQRYPPSHSRTVSHRSAHTLHSILAVAVMARNPQADSNGGTSPSPNRTGQDFSSIGARRVGGSNSVPYLEEGKGGREDG